MRYGIIGDGFIASRHKKAIKETGGELVWTCDNQVPSTYFDWHVALHRYVDYVVICTPNDLHYPMIKGCLDQGLKVICEKPLTLNWDDYQALKETDVNVVLQLREKKWKKLEGDIDLEIHIHRGDWYFKGWKNTPESGGLLFNIGIHYFDLMSEMYGSFLDFLVEEQTEKRASGRILFKDCKVDWSLRLDAKQDNQIREYSNGKESISLTGFEDLHTKVYESILKGQGTKVKDIERTMQMLCYADKVRS